MGGSRRGIRSECWGKGLINGKVFETERFAWESSGMFGKRREIYKEQFEGFGGTV